RRRHTRFSRDWSSDVCSSDLQSYTVNNLAPGTYTYYLTLTTAKKPGDYGYTDQTPNVAMPACTIPVTFTLEPTPDLNFTLAAQRSEERRVGKECRSRSAAYRT